jgi:hypothetical protein
MVDFESDDDDLQRILNDAKRADLEQRYGARFHRIGAHRIPPDVEAEWLNHIEEFERQLETASTLTLREFARIGPVRPLLDLPAMAVETELRDLLNRLAEQDVFIDCADGTDASDLYRFLTEELLDEPVLDIRIPGMRMRFLFEHDGKGKGN